MLGCLLGRWAPWEEIRASCNKYDVKIVKIHPAVFFEVAGSLLEQEVVQIVAAPNIELGFRV
jgi:hypothetical protein